MNRITMGLIICIGMVLATSSYVCMNNDGLSLHNFGDDISLQDVDTDGDGYADTILIKDVVGHEDVCEYADRPICQKEEDEQICEIGKVPMLLRYFDNRLLSMRFFNGIRENPIMEIDSVTTDVYRFNCFTKHINVNLKNKENVDAFIDFNCPLPGFSAFKRYFTRSYKNGCDKGDCTCSLYVEYPNKIDIQNVEDINRWLVGFINTADYWGESFFYQPFNGNVNDKEAVARFFANRFYAFTENDYDRLENELDLRAYELNDRYVTYQKYTYVYLGGIHGFYTEQLVSFDLNTRVSVTPDYLFKKESQMDVRRLLVKAAIADEKFRSWNGDMTMDDAIRCFMPETMTIENIVASMNPDYVQPNVRLDRVNITRIGLTRDGVVFSFYPYELSCFAAGCFHFLIPYNQLRPYLTNQAKRCIGIL